MMHSGQQRGSGVQRALTVPAARPGTGMRLAPGWSRPSLPNAASCLPERRSRLLLGHAEQRGSFVRLLLSNLVFNPIDPW